MSLEEELYQKLNEVTYTLAQYVSNTNNSINSIQNKIENINEDIDDLSEMKDNVENAINKYYPQISNRKNSITLESSYTYFSSNDEFKDLTAIGIKVSLPYNKYVLKGTARLFYISNTDVIEITGDRYISSATENTEENIILWYFPTDDGEFLLPSEINYTLIESYIIIKTPDMNYPTGGVSNAIPSIYYNCQKVTAIGLSIYDTNNREFIREFITDKIRALPSNTKFFTDIETTVSHSVSQAFDKANLLSVDFPNATSLADVVSSSAFKCTTTQNLDRIIKIRFPKIVSIGNGTGSTTGAVFYGKLDIEIPSTCKTLGRYLFYDNQSKMTVRLKCTDATIDQNWCSGSSINNLILDSNWKANIKLDTATNGKWTLNDYKDLLNNKLIDWTEIEDDNGNLYTPETAENDGFMREIVLPSSKLQQLENNQIEGGAQAIQNARDKLWRITGGNN